MATKPAQQRKNIKWASDPRLPTVYTTADIILMACKPVLWSEIKND